MKAETVHVLAESAIIGTEPSVYQMSAQQQKEYGDLVTYVKGRSDMLEGEDGILRVGISRDLPVFVSPTMVSQGLKQAHGSELAGGYRKQRTTASMKDKY